MATLAPRSARLFLICKDTIRLLGVIFDLDLNFHSRFDYMKQISEVSAPHLLTFIRLCQKLDGKLISRLCSQVLSPSLTYALPPWWSKFLTKFLKTQILSALCALLIIIASAIYAT